MLQFQEWCVLQCQYNLEADGYRKILNSPPKFKFDLIIMDITAGSCFYPMMERLGYPPSVAVTPFLLPQYISNSFGNLLYPNYIPWYGLPYTKNMGFFQRVWNTFYTYFDIYYRYYDQYVKERKLAVEAFGDNIPSMKDLERHFSIVLANTSPLLDHVQPLPPNIIPVGGLHTGKPKPVPEVGTNSSLFFFFFFTNFSLKCSTKSKTLFIWFYRQPSVLLYSRFFQLTPFFFCHFQFSAAFSNCSRPRYFT